MVIYRAFGDPAAEVIARALRRITLERDLLLLVGADPVLARRVKADGVHLPQRLSHLAGRLRRGRPGWLVTAAAHDLIALRKAKRSGAQIVLLSAVFASRSPSAGAALGPCRFEALARQARIPVIALGGVNARTARRLSGGSAAGLAAIDGLLDRLAGVCDQF